MKFSRSSAFQTRIRQGEQGFTLVEVMISMVILTIGLLAMLSVFGIAMAATQTAQENGTAKQLANEAIESILTARETANVTWTQIQNTGAGGIFLAGFNPVNCPGVDGIIGTADDAACGPKILRQPGPSGVYANNCAIDVCTPLTNFTRSIAILPVFPAGGGPALSSLRQVNITVQYNTPQFKLPRQYVLSTYVSQYR